MIDLLLESVYLQVVLLDEPCSLYVELLDHKNHGLHMVPHALILLLKGLIEVKDVLAAVTESHLCDHLLQVQPAHSTIQC